MEFQDEPLPYSTTGYLLTCIKHTKKYFSDEIVIHRERMFCIYYTTMLNFCLVIYGSANIQFIINIFNIKSNILNVTSNIYT